MSANALSDTTLRRRSVTGGRREAGRNALKSRFMARKSKRRPAPPPPAPSPPAPKRWQWLAKPWAMVVAVVAAVGAFLLNINPILTNVRQLPSEVGKTNDQFVGWLYQDKAWEGYWRSETVEGDAVQAISPDGRMGLDLMEVTDGAIDGTIATPQTCDLIPAFDFFLVSGKVRPFGRTARVTIWDGVLGKKVQFAELELTRNGTSMSVRPLGGKSDLFPATISISRQPGGSAGLEPICDPKKKDAWLRSIMEEAKQRSTIAPYVEGAGVEKSGVQGTR